MRNFIKYGLNIDPAGKEEQYCTCPECSESRKAEHQKLKCCGVNITKGVWHCNHCGASGYVPTIKEEQKTRQLEQKRKELPRQGNYKRPTWQPEFVVNNILIPNAQQQEVLNYLTQQRKLSLETLAQARISLQWKNKQWVMAFNYFDHDILINQKLRTLDKGFQLYQGAEVIPYNIDAILNQEVCYITEGEMDALSLVQAGFTQAISVPTGGANKNLNWLDRFIETHFLDKKKIFLAVDMDEVGLILRKELVRRLGSERCLLVTWSPDCKDANEELQLHGTQGIAQCIEKATPIPPYGIQTLESAQVNRELDELFANGLGHGNTVGLAGFDQLMGFETGRFMVVTGRPGEGKSEFIDELCLRLNVKYGWKTAYFSPENYPVKYHHSKLISKLTGYEFKKNGHMTDELYARSKEWLKQNVCHIVPGSNDAQEDAAELRAEDFTLSEVLKVAHDAVVLRGVRVCVFDPLNSIYPDDSRYSMKELEWYLHMLNTMLSFAQQHDVLVILVAHPRKVDRSSFDNSRRRVEMNDINGSSDFANKCDYCLCVDKDDDLQVVTIYVDKVKFKHLGHRGQTYLHYDMLSGRYVPCTLRKLSENDYYYMQQQSLPSDQTLVHSGSTHYLKTVDWRNFNCRWV